MSVVEICAGLVNQDVAFYGEALLPDALFLYEKEAHATSKSTITLLCYRLNLRNLSKPISRCRVFSEKIARVYEKHPMVSFTVQTLVNSKAL